VQCSPQGAELTPSGEVLLRCGINIFDELRPNSGEVRLGCTDIILPSLASTVVRKFSAKYPGVQFDVRLVNPGEHQLRELRERRIDLLITRTTDQSASEDLHSEMLFDEPFVFVIGAESEFARRRRVVLGDIIGCKWVLPAPDSAPGALMTASSGSQAFSRPRQSSRRSRSS
jgi:DNA-binding transcriptional LysR family regulator